VTAAVAAAMTAAVAAPVTAAVTAALAATALATTALATTLTAALAATALAATAGARRRARAGIARRVRPRCAGVAPARGTVVSRWLPGAATRTRGIAGRRSGAGFRVGPGHRTLRCGTRGDLAPREWPVDIAASGAGARVIAERAGASTPVGQRDRRA
jgi:hypothetical protein